MKKTLIIASAALIFCTSFGQIKLNNETSFGLARTQRQLEGKFEKITQFEADLPPSISVKDFSFSSFGENTIHLGRNGSVPKFLRTGNQLSGKTTVFIYDIIKFPISYHEILDFIEQHEGIAPNGFGLAQLWKANKSDLEQLPEFTPLLAINQEVSTSSSTASKFSLLHRTMENNWSGISAPFSGEILDTYYVVFFKKE